MANTSISDVVLQSRNLSPQAKKRLSEQIANKTAELEDCNIDKYIVFAELDYHAKKGPFLVKIVAMAMGKAFIASNSSQYGGMLGAYNGANSKLKKDIREYKDKIQDYRR